VRTNSLDHDAGLALLTGGDAAGPLEAALSASGGTLRRWAVKQVDHQPRLSTTVSYAATVRWGDGNSTTIALTGGEREFIAAFFPGYLGELHYAAFVPDTLDEALERRSQCGREPVSRYMNTEHVEADPDSSDAQLAETFLHHRVLIIPIVERRHVKGIVTRGDFFRAAAERLRP
jgi:CBS domain-containing protein